MTAKRYFKRMWEEEYYIFDSQTISENEFDEKVEYEDYQAFEDSMQGDEVVNKLNELTEENEQLRTNNAYIQDIEVFKEEKTHLKLENEDLKQRNNRQAKRLGELYELISKKDWESLIEIIDDFCSCEEQLQKEWGIYE